MFCIIVLSFYPISSERAVSNFLITSLSSQKSVQRLASKSYPINIYQINKLTKYIH